MKYLPSSVDRTLFQWSLDVVKYDVGVETGPSYESLSPPTVSCTLWVLVFWGLMSHTMRLYVDFMSWFTSCLIIKKHVSVPSIYNIPWKRRPISFVNSLVHFVLSVPLIRCLYSWGFPVYGLITAFIWLGWIVTSPVVFLVCAHYSPILWTEHTGTVMLGGFSG